MTSIAIIIVNYRTPHLVVQCLESLAQDESLLKQATVVVVDNHSDDGSVAILHEALTSRGWKTWVHVMPTEHNQGFGAGNNLAIQWLMNSSHMRAPDYIMFLNPDTIVAPGAIQLLVNCLDRHPQAGAAGAALSDDDGKPQHSSHAFPSLLQEINSALNLGILDRRQSTSTTCDWVSGAAFMIRTTALRQVGLFDQQFFLYFEEVDLCRRLRTRGWQIAVVPDSHITHLEGASTGNRDRLTSSAHWRASRRTYWRKHHGHLGLVLADIARTAAGLLALAITPLRAVFRRRGRGLPKSLSTHGPSLNLPHAPGRGSPFSTPADEVA